MPHECVECGKVFDDGTRDVLDGCPECGGNKFLYAKKKPKPNSDNETCDDSEKDLIEATSETSPSASDTGSQPDVQSRESEQHSDQSEESSSGVSESGQINTDTNTDTGEESATDTDNLRPADKEELRQELMEQFETIKIIEPGSYKLNLMNLYSKDEKIIALQEDGRYQVSLPSAFEDD